MAWLVEEGTYGKRDLPPREVGSWGQSVSQSVRVPGGLLEGYI